MSKLTFSQVGILIDEAERLRVKARKLQTVCTRIASKERTTAKPDECEIDRQEAIARDWSAVEEHATQELQRLVELQRSAPNE